LVDVFGFCQGRSVGDGVETFPASHRHDAVVVQQKNGVTLWRRPNVDDGRNVAEIEQGTLTEGEGSVPLTSKYKLVKISCFFSIEKIIIFLQNKPP
jgi:hypothetical protein